MWTPQHYIWAIFLIGLLAVWLVSTFDVKLFYVQITSCLGHSVAITQSSSTTACPAPAKTRIKIRTPSPAPTTRAISAGDKVFPPERVWYSFSIAMKLLCNLYVRCGLVNNYIWPLSTGQYTFGLAYIGISWPSSPGISNWRSAPMTEDSGCLVHKSNLYMSCQLLIINDFWSWKVVPKCRTSMWKLGILLDQPVTKQLQKPHEGIIPIYIGWDQSISHHFTIHPWHFDVLERSQE